MRNRLCDGDSGRVTKSIADESRDGCREWALRQEPLTRAMQMTAPRAAADRHVVTRRAWVCSTRCIPKKLRVSLVLYARHARLATATIAVSVGEHPQLRRLLDRSLPRLASRAPFGPDGVLAIRAVDAPGRAGRPGERGAADRPAGAMEATAAGVTARGVHYRGITPA